MGIPDQEVTFFDTFLLNLSLREHSNWIDIFLITIIQSTCVLSEL